MTGAFRTGDFHRCNAKVSDGEEGGGVLYERMNGYDGPSRHEVLRAQPAIRNSTLKTAAKTLDAIVLDDRNTIYK